MVLFGYLFGPAHDLLEVVYVRGRKGRQVCAAAFTRKKYISHLLFTLEDRSPTCTFYKLGYCIFRRNFYRNLVLKIGWNTCEVVNNFKLYYILFVSEGNESENARVL